MKYIIRLSVFSILIISVLFCYYYMSYSNDTNIVYSNKKINSSELASSNEKVEHVLSPIDRKEEKIPIFEPPTEEQKKNFLENRDDKSFETLADAYFYEDVYGEGLIYAIIAANRFGIPRGNGYVYLFLTNFGACKELDERTEKMAIHYLKRGILAKDENSEQLMNNLEQCNMQDKKDKVIAKKGIIQCSSENVINNIQEIKKQVLNGNVKYYKVLKDLFNKNPYSGEFVFYSIMMANRFDYVPANYDVYKGMIDAYSNNHLGHIDNETYKLALSFLEYGAKRGDKKAIVELQKLNK